MENWVRSLAVACSAVAGAITLAPAPLAASWDQISYYGCTTSLSACASVEVATYWDGTQTNVMIRMRNWSGVRTTSPDGRGRVIHGFTIGAWVWTDSQLAEKNNFTTIGQVTKVGGGASWMWESWLTPVGLYIGYDEPAWPNGVAGCETSGFDGFPYAGYFSTCAARDEESWAVFSFATTNQWSASDYSVNLWVSPFPPSGPYAYGAENIGCSPPDSPTIDEALRSRGGNAAEGYFGTCSVVPEPLTMTLLATGLAGLAGVRILQRRKKRDVIA